MNKTDEINEKDVNSNEPHLSGYANKEYLALQREPVLYRWLGDVPKLNHGLLTISLATFFIFLGAIFDELGADLFLIVVLHGAGVYFGCVFYFLDRTELVEYSMTANGIYFIRDDLMQKALSYFGGVLFMVTPFISYAIYSLYGAYPAIMLLAAWLGLRLYDIEVPKKYRHIGMLFTEGSGELIVDRKAFSINILGRDSDVCNYMLLHCQDYNFKQTYKVVRDRVPSYKVLEESAKKKIGW